MAGVKASWAISSHCIACLQTSLRMYAAKRSCSGKADVAVAGWDCGYFWRGVGAGRSERRYVRGGRQHGRVIWSFATVQTAA
jgi:hypothetical protein